MKAAPTGTVPLLLLRVRASASLCVLLVPHLACYNRSRLQARQLEETATMTTTSGGSEGASGGSPEPMRVEKDSLGEVRVPAGALYGAQTQRAVENFPISGMHAHPAMIEATVLVKKAAALSNMETGRLDRRVGEAIVRAADEVLAGQWRDQFVVDVYQAGAGTSHNMNANEVLANRATELLGGRRGAERLVEPNDDVNMAQSTNDVVPTAMRLAALELAPAVIAALAELSRTFAEKARSWDGIVKSGRTHLMDATPIRLGQEVSGWAAALNAAGARVRDAL